MSNGDLPTYDCRFIFMCMKRTNNFIFQILLSLPKNILQYPHEAKSSNDQTIYHPLLNFNNPYVKADPCDVGLSEVTILFHKQSVNLMFDFYGYLPIHRKQLHGTTHVDPEMLLWKHKRNGLFINHVSQDHNHLTGIATAVSISVVTHQLC